jgi:hypothetical protein
MGPTKPIQPIANAAGHNQRIIHWVRFIISFTFYKSDSDSAMT